METKAIYVGARGARPSTYMKRGACHAPLYLLAVAALSIIVACGVKGSPRPPLKAAPPRVQDIAVWPRENYNLIKWTTPIPRQENTLQTQVSTFVILRWARPPGDTLWSEVWKLAVINAPPEGGEATWEDRDVKPGFAYRYQVVAVDSDGRQSDVSPMVQAQWDNPPAAPANLRAEAGDRSVTLLWDPPTGDVPIEGYFIYRVAPGGFVRLNEGAVVGNSFFDAALSNGETYRYVVRATRMAGTSLVEGPASDEVEVKPADLIAPQTPVGAGAFPAEGGVLVRWWPNEEPDLAGYIVYRAEKGKPSRLTASPLADAEYLDTGAQTGHVYYYTVTAIDNAGNESPASEPAKVFVKR